MSFTSSLANPQSLKLFYNSSNRKHRFGNFRSPSFRFRASAEIPDYLSADWLEARKKRPFGPTLNFSAEEAVSHQLDALKYNDQPHQDYGIEVLYRFAGFDPFERSTYFGPHFDLGQDRFKQRVWVQGTRPGQEEIFEFTMVQKLGGCWDGYWLTESLHHDGDSFSGGMAY
ncbi:uncharacterized protein LOC130801484 isoform X5 [Amaranthus tricolor]|uniref:uncharacterized protein LOC130801484 isoform X5 n=1 Tax=Amaranthus tricolor TaxID=29722 RepID=UPI00258E8FE9|nr:uncharacterized protein LOC130801484 isoform X5 [Amaranthus tricolor]